MIKQTKQLLNYILSRENHPNKIRMEISAKQVNMLSGEPAGGCDCVTHFKLRIEIAKYLALVFQSCSTV